METVATSLIALIPVILFALVIYRAIGKDTKDVEIKGSWLGIDLSFKTKQLPQTKADQPPE